MKSDMMAFQDLLNGHELIAKHTNSVKELPSKGLKEFSPNNSWLEKKRIENQLEEKFNFIKAERIEKSNCVSQAEWVPELKKAKVTKKIGKSWETLGHHLDNEDWLFPEEALFLIENCELQLFYDSVCISIEDFYTLVFHEDDDSFDEYRVYAYLSRAGLKVVRHSPSVSATHYERQVKLDSIIQMQRRSPPRPSQENITFIDDDISIVEEPKNKENNSTEGTTNASILSETNSAKTTVQSTSSAEIIIEIDDEPDAKESTEVEIKDIDSDSDSDIVCISSPSYMSEKNSRPWYPTIQKCLRKPMESLIDLSDDTDVADNQTHIQSTIDLVKVSKANILSEVPSAINGVAFIKVPDRRLLPPNVFPRYSEYKVNLNIKSDNRNQDWTVQNNTIPNGSFPFNNIDITSGISNNPLLMKAQEMQVMALSMIQTAASLMSVAQSANQNPNELWNMNYGNNMQSIAQNNPNELWNLSGHQNMEMSSYNSNIPIVNHIRPRFWHPPRRRFPRWRRGSYDRRYPWPPRRPPRVGNPCPQSNYIDVKNFEPCASTPEIVVLSDDEDVQDLDEESTPDFSNKRKKNGEVVSNKRLKTEDDPDCDSVVISENSFTMEDLPSTSSSIKKESAPDVSSASSSVKKEITLDVSSVSSSVKKEITLDVSSASSSVKKEITLEVSSVSSSIKKEITQDVSYGSSSVRMKIDEDIVKSESQIKTECSCEVKTESLDNKEFLKNSLSTDKDSLKQNGFHEIQQKNIPESNAKTNSLPKQPAEEEHHITDKSSSIKLQEPSSLSKKHDSSNVIQENVDGEPLSSDSNLNIELIKGSSCSISSSEKQLNISSREVSEEILSWEQYKKTSDVYEEDVDSLIKFDQCENYGQVLSALQIFKPIEVGQVAKKFKISFDIYLPDSNFKKKLKVLPNYRVIILKASQQLPTSLDIQGLKAEYQDNIPFLFSIVFEESITFFLYDTVSLNTFYE